MGFLQNIFGKKVCVLCGKECGPTQRTKIKDKEFICSECTSGCSKYIELSRLTKDQVVGHQEYMRRMEIMYNEAFVTSKTKKSFPSYISDVGIVISQDIGMFQIVEKRKNPNRKLPELFRLDSLASYEPYVKMEKDDKGNEKPKEAGITLKFGKPVTGVQMGSEQSARPHPFIERDLVLCFAKNEKECNEQENTINGIVGVFDFLLGKTASRKPLFGKSKEQKLQNAAVGELAKGMGAMLKAGKAMKNGEAVDEEAVKDQLQKASDAFDDMHTGGLAVFTRRADEAESKYFG